MHEHDSQPLQGACNLQGHYSFYGAPVHFHVCSGLVWGLAGQVDGKSYSLNQKPEPEPPNPKPEIPIPLADFM